jgi:hypothetical protein
MQRFQFARPLLQAQSVAARHHQYSPRTTFGIRRPLDSSALFPLIYGAESWPLPMK